MLVLRRKHPMELAGCQIPPSRDFWWIIQARVMPDLHSFHMHRGEKVWSKLPYLLSRSPNCFCSDEPPTVPHWFLPLSGPMKLPLLQTGSQLCWGQGGLWTFQDKHMCKSLSGWGSQDTAYSEPEKQLHWRTLLRPEFRGITEAVQKYTALKPSFFFESPSTSSKMCSLLALTASLF